MTTTILSSRDFNQDTSRARKAAADRPVLITDRGKPAHVLLNIGEYQRIPGGHCNLAEALSLPGLSTVEVDFPRRHELVAPDSRSDRDALIAATALVHGVTVATRNTEDFNHTGVPLLNPWDRITA